MLRLLPVGPGAPVETGGPQQKQGGLASTDGLGRIRDLVALGGGNRRGRGDDVIGPGDARPLGPHRFEAAAKTT